MAFYYSIFHYHRLDDSNSDDSNEAMADGSEKLDLQSDPLKVETPTGKKTRMRFQGKHI